MSNEAKRIDDGGPAFPTTSDDYASGLGGMSLRDYFAAKAMVSLQSDRGSKHASPIKDMPFDVQARSAYAMADAMITARAAIANAAKVRKEVGDA